MQRLRSLHHKRRYTQIANDAIDSLPSLEAVGLLATILRHNDDFDFQMSVLIKSKPGLGEQKAYRARTTLIQHGYLVQVKFKHAYRGRMCTDVYRSSEPHTADDLALLRERYTPGSEATITDDDGRERQVTILWSEITSATGPEEVRTDAGAKPQVAPDPGFPGPGDPGPGQPGPGNPGSHKEDSGEDQKEQQQQGPADAGVVDEAIPDKPSEDDRGALVVQAQELLARIRRDQAPGLVAHQPYLDAVADQLAAGYDQEAVRKVLTEGLESYRTPAKGVVVNIGDLTARLAENGSHGGSQGQKPAIPAWCGQCEAPDARFVWIDEERQTRCPYCHPVIVGRTTAA